MIGIILKSTIAFAVSFVVLSFQVNERPLFSHLTEVLGPLGSDIQESIGKSVKRGIDKSGHIGKEFFENSEPKYMDAIKSERSSLHNGDEIILENIKADEQKKLDEMIQNN